VIADDQARMRYVIRSIVERVGFEVVGEAADGNAVIDVASDCKPDAVIMDYHMPDMDGLQATLVLKQLHPDLQVIAYTSTDDPAVRQAFLEAGACDHIEKGEVDELIAAIARCAARPQ